MGESLTTGHLEALVTTIDASAEGNEGHVLVSVIGADGEGADVGFRPIDGHPLDTVLGFVAPPSWLALGVCAEGWAASTDSGCRPSEARGRVRMRSTTLVTRDGRVASGMRLAGGDLRQLGGGEGTVIDALKRAVGVATTPPEAPYVGWVARMLLLLIIGDVPNARHRVPWCQLRPSLERAQVLARDGSWAALRGLASRRAGVVADLTPAAAAWMDDGMFSRWAIGGLPSYDRLLADARRACTEEAFTQLRRQLRAWGLPARVRIEQSADSTVTPPS